MLSQNNLNVIAKRAWAQQSDACAPTVSRFLRVAAPVRRMGGGAAGLCAHSSACTSRVARGKWVNRKVVRLAWSLQHTARWLKHAAVVACPGLQ